MFGAGRGNRLSYGRQHTCPPGFGGGRGRVSPYLFGNVGGARVHADATLFIAAAATPEHVHTGGLEEHVGAPPQLAGHLHARLSGAALGSLPFLVDNCGEVAVGASGRDGPDRPVRARVSPSTVIFTSGVLVIFPDGDFGGGGVGGPVL